MEPLLVESPAGLYCPAGDFYIDPWQAVPRAVITHAHSDHARLGSQRYLCAAAGRSVLRLRLEPDARIDTLEYGEKLTCHETQVSFHPAGHILGSAQVRIEHRGQVWVVSGDYKVQSDPTCATFEPVRCHTFVTESTFGLPIYRWAEPATIYADINAWWQQNQQDARTSVLFAYSLGKAQRVLAGLDPAIGPILLHGAVSKFATVYREAGVPLPLAEYATNELARATRGRAFVLAPPSAHNSPWIRKFGPISTAMASGWMQVRGMRRRRAIDRGFAFSDHADWEGLDWAIKSTGCEQVWVTHGYTGVLVRWLQERGLPARAVATQFAGEAEDETSLEPESE